MLRSFFKKMLALLLVLGSATAVFGQDQNLANQYFINGEYEKAATLYLQLWEEKGGNDYYFTRYVDCLMNLEQYDECEKVIKKQLRKSPENVNLYVSYGNVFDRQGRSDEAKAQYAKAIEKMAPDFGAVTRLASIFVNMAKYDFAIQTYESGARTLGDPRRFAFNLGELYRRKGDNAKMIEQYLISLDDDPGKLGTIQTMLARYLPAGDFAELQQQLYARIQTEESPEMVELLAWSFVQRKDFKNALRQYKALDRRLGEDGNRIMKICADAAAARDYDAAIAGYEHILTEKGVGSAFYFDAKRELMNCRRRKITEGFSYTQEELRALESEYEAFLNQYGKGKPTATMVLQLADLEAYNINNLPKAIGLLNELLAAPGVDKSTQARAKINLADFYLMSGEIWESTLLFSQVDKDFREEQLGQEARFKNARLSYFNGDFQWAQAQFDVLKASTSKLIANDALDLSVFIMDNLNLDTTSEAIALYSGAELLMFQSRFEEAFLKLDTLRRNFPEHALQDDILYLEAQIFERKRDWQKAAELYQKVADTYKEDIRADNALYALAQIFEMRLNEPEKAKSLYERIFMDYSGSVFSVEARKRFRALRGDKVQ